MGNRRKTKRGRSREDKSLNALYVVALATSLKQGLVSLPASVSVYHRAIYAAFDGNFQPLNQAILRLEKANNAMQAMADKSMAMSKWTNKMNAFNVGQYYILTAFSKLLKEFHKGLENAANTIPTKSIGHHGISDYFNFGCQEEYTEDDCNIVKRERI